MHDYQHFISSFVTNEVILVSTFLDGFLSSFHNSHQCPNIALQSTEFIVYTTYITLKLFYFGIFTRLALGLDIKRDDNVFFPIRVTYYSRGGQTFNLYRQSQSMAVQKLVTKIKFDFVADLEATLCIVITKDELFSVSI